MSDFKGIVRSYLGYFSGKDIESIHAILSDNIAVHDWTGSFYGLSEVLALYENIFNDFNRVEVRIKRVCSDKNYVVTELEVILDSQQLSVIDVVEFDEDGHISCIRAYRR